MLLLLGQYNKLDLSRIVLIRVFNQISIFTYYQRLLYNNDLKYLVSGHEDHKIRFCDLNTGKIYKSLICHTDAVTDLCVLQNVYLLASVSHDGSMRTWDIRKFQCLHEIPVRIILIIRLINRNMMREFMPYKVMVI